MAQIVCLYIVVSALVTALLIATTRCRLRACLLWGFGLGTVLVPLAVFALVPVVLGA